MNSLYYELQNFETQYCKYFTFSSPAQLTRTQSFCSISLVQCTTHENTVILFHFICSVYNSRGHRNFVPFYLFSVHLTKTQ